MQSYYTKKMAKGYNFAVDIYHLIRTETLKKLQALLKIQPEAEGSKYYDIVLDKSLVGIRPAGEAETVVYYPPFKFSSSGVTDKSDCIVPGSPELSIEELETLKKKVELVGEESAEAAIEIFRTLETAANNREDAIKKLAAQLLYL